MAKTHPVDSLAWGTPIFGRYLLRLGAADLRFATLDALLAHLDAQGIEADAVYICDTETSDEERLLSPADAARVKAHADGAGQ